MPINIPNDLPAWDTLEQENIFIMSEKRARSQDIRPLRILILNLMPKRLIPNASCCVCSAIRRFRWMWNFCKPLPTPLKIPLLTTFSNFIRFFKIFVSSTLME